MSHSQPPTSHLSLLNVINTTANFPAAKRAGLLITNAAAAFGHATSQNPPARFAAVVIATMMTAGSIWGIQFTLGHIPIYFVKKTLLPTIECAVKAGLTWVIFQAFNASVNEVHDISKF